MPALAQDDAKQRKIYELMDVLGFKRELEKLTTPDGLADLTVKFLTGKPPVAMSEQQRNADATVHQKYLMPLIAKIDIQKMMQVWAEAYGRSMTEADVDAALEYHKSPVGQKDIAAQRLAAEAYTAMSMAELGSQQRDGGEDEQGDGEHHDGCVTGRRETQKLRSPGPYLRREGVVPPAQPMVNIA